jgi:hypothetical protein
MAPGGALFYEPDYDKLGFQNHANPGGKVFLYPEVMLKREPILGPRWTIYTDGKQNSISGKDPAELESICAALKHVV